MRTLLHLVFCVAILVLVVPGCSEPSRDTPQNPTPKDVKPALDKDGKPKVIAQ